MEASLEDLRQQAPALCPCGLLDHGARRSRRAPAQSRPPVLTNADGAPAMAEALARWRAVPARVPRPVRRDADAPAAASVLRLQHRALLLASVPEGSLARVPQVHVPAPASAHLAGAAEGAWHRK